VLRRVIVEFLFSSLECSSSGRCCRGASRHGTYVSGNNDVQWRNCDISDPKIGSSKMGIRITLFFEQRRGEGVAGSSAAWKIKGLTRLLYLLSAGLRLWAPFGYQSRYILTPGGSDGGVDGTQGAGKTLVVDGLTEHLEMPILFLAFNFNLAWILGFCTLLTHHQKDIILP